MTPHHVCCDAAAFRCIAHLLPLCPRLLQVIQVVCCRMTELQTLIYQHFAHSATARRIISEAEAGDRHAGGNKILAVRHMGPGRDGGMA